jgi:sugar lactone lactonase YvrE
MNAKLVLLVFVSMAVGIACKKDKTVEPIEPPVAVKKWVVSTVAGDGNAGFADGAALQAKLNIPLDITVTPDGTIYFADAFNHRIRKIVGGQVSSFAGNDRQDTVSGTGADAGFSLPIRLATDQDNNLFVLDAAYPTVRKITPAARVSKYSGTGVRGFRDGEAGIAQFGQSFGIIVNQLGDIYMCDAENFRIRKISATGEVSTIAGNGRSGFVNGASDVAQFIFPTGIVIDRQGNLIVADHHRIRKITPGGVVSTLAGNDQAGFRDGQPGDAQFMLIEDLVIDEQGNIYASDNNRIRRITAQGEVSTIAGSTEAGYADGDGAVAKFNLVQGLGIDRQGNIYVADVENNRIRKVSFQ